MEPIKPRPLEPLEVVPPTQRLRRAVFPITKFYRGTTMNQILKFLRDRLKEGSTWGAAAILGLLGVSGEVSSAAVEAAIALISLILVLKPDKQVKESNGDTTG